jgi:hypothetical protein
MDKTRLLITAMAEKCGQSIAHCARPNADLPAPLQPKHLAWMCEQIANHAELWHAAKLHRWIGFVQCAMLAHGMLDLPAAKAMFDEAKNAYGPVSDDFFDHLDPGSTYKMDIGGEG